MDSEMKRALEADGAKLRQLIGEDHGPFSCERCQGNGEIVLDWEAYLHPADLAAEEKSVGECPDCHGYGFCLRPSSSLTSNK